MKLIHPKTGEEMELLKPEQIEMPRSANNYDAAKLSDATGLHCPEKTLTQQQFGEEVDINFIAEKFHLNGTVPQVLDLPQYGDFTGIYDFQQAQNAVIHAQQQFMTLPAKMRARFNNDPQQLLTFLNDDKNKEEAIFLGLVKKPEDAQQSPKGDTGAKIDPASPTGKVEAPVNPKT